MILIKRKTISGSCVCSQCVLSREILEAFNSLLNLEVFFPVLKLHFFLLIFFPLHLFVLVSLANAFSLFSVPLCVTADCSVALLGSDTEQQADMQLTVSLVGDRLAFVFLRLFPGMSQMQYVTDTNLV